MEIKTLQEIVFFLLIYNDSKEALDKIQTFDSSCSKSSYKNVTLCPNNSNIITKDQSQENSSSISSKGLRNQKSKINAFMKLKAYYPKIKLSNQEYNLSA